LCTAIRSVWNTKSANRCPVMTGTSRSSRAKAPRTVTGRASPRGFGGARAASSPAKTREAWAALDVRLTVDGSTPSSSAVSTCNRPLEILTTSACRCVPPARMDPTRFISADRTWPEGSEKPATSSQLDCFFVAATASLARWRHGPSSRETSSASSVARAPRPHPHARPSGTRASDSRTMMSTSVSGCSVSPGPHLSP